MACFLCLYILDKKIGYASKMIHLPLLTRLNVATL